MGKWIFRIVLFIAAVGLVVWFMRRNRANSRRDRDLVGCTGLVETAMNPGERGRVRLKDKSGQSVILPAKLDDGYPFAVDRGTEIVVVENARSDTPIVVSVAELPGSDEG